MRVAVVDDAGAAIPDAWIEARTGDPLPFLAKTDEHGQSSMTRIGPPPWMLKVRASGFETVSQTVSKASAEATKVTLRRLGWIDVNAVDTEGRAIAGATVLVAGSGLWPARKTQTDEQGHAKVSRLAARHLRFPRDSGRSGLACGDGRGARTRRVEIGHTDPRRRSSRRGACDRWRRRRSRGGVGREPRARRRRALVVSARSNDRRARCGELGPDRARRRIHLGQGRRLRSQDRRRDPSRAVPLGAHRSRARRDAASAMWSTRRGFPVDGASIEVIGTMASGEPIDESPQNVAFRAAHFSWALTGPRDLVPAGELGVMRGPIPGIPHAGAMPAGLLRGHGTAPPPEPWVTRNDGAFRAFPVPPGRVRAIVHHAAYLEGMSDLVTLASGGEASVHVVLHGGGTLEGRVFDDRHTPVGSVRVDIAAAKGSLERTTFTGKRRDVRVCRGTDRNRGLGVSPRRDRRRRGAHQRVAQGRRAQRDRARPACSARCGDGRGQRRSRHRRSTARRCCFSRSPPSRPCVELFSPIARAALSSRMRSVSRFVSRCRAAAARPPSARSRARRRRSRWSCKVESR